LKYVEAFRSLGYVVDAPRTDWSAEKSDGICITIWQRERGVKDGLPYLDLWELHPSGGAWEGKPGHAKRTRHLTRCISEFNGKVDVIFVQGDPGTSYDNAVPWDSIKRGAGWHIARFDPQTGYFRAEVDAPAARSVRR